LNGSVLSLGIFSPLSTCSARSAATDQIGDSGVDINGTTSSPVVAPRAISRAVPKGTPVVLLVEVRRGLVTRIAGMMRLIGAI